MLEFLLAGAVLAALAASSVAITIHGARRRSRARAERVLDELAAEACAALARDDASRRTARAITRYDRAQQRVAAARTCRELESVIARHRLRQGAWELAAQGAERVRALLPASVAVRR